MADNGKDAYDKAVQLNAHPGEQLDVIFMDMQMPVYSTLDIPLY